HAGEQPPRCVGVGFAMVWLTNLYNFMDGADGLAGGMALFGFGGYAVAALGGPHTSPDLAVAGAVVAGAALGFLLLNFHPARLFLGDDGSIPLGFLA
ncbi:glycosyl transferase, partial [Burkholderia cenocepacia]|nr:glycosyl transferase [Burkholderia cenocepacia]